MAAFVTFLFLAHIHNANGADSTETIDGYTSISMLVSVGTFLYVTTVHILPEVFLKESPHNHESELEQGVIDNETLTETSPQLVQGS